MSKILIVDDSPTDIYLAKKCAGELFAEVRAVFNVEDFFKELETFKPDLVLMDVMLADYKNGISLICEVRSLDNENSIVPIIVLSSRGLPSDMNHAERAGASGYLVKPISVPALYAAARKVVVGFPERAEFEAA